MPIVALVAPVGLAPSSLGEVGASERWEVDRTATASRLRLGPDELAARHLEAPTDVEHRVVRGDVGPPQREDLPASHPGRESQDHGKLESRAFHEPEQPSGHRRVDDGRLAPTRSRGLGSGHRFHEDESPPLGLTERLRENEVKVQHRARREPFGKQRCVEALDREGTERIERKIAQVRNRVQRDERPVALERLRADPPGNVDEPVREIRYSET